MPKAKKVEGKEIIAGSLDNKIKDTETRKQQLQDNLVKLSKMIEETRAQLIFIEGKLEAYKESETKEEK